VYRTGKLNELFVVSRFKPDIGLDMHKDSEYNSVHMDS